MTAAKTYDLRVVTEFSSAHVLRGYPGACEQVHGHNFRVEVEVRAHRLDELGMGIDFRELTRMTEEVTARLDHRLLNEVAPFDEVNPTAENIAAHIYHRLGHALADSEAGERVRMLAVTVHENDRISARYHEQG